MKKCLIIFVDFGVEKCESRLANSIRNVPSIGGGAWERGIEDGTTIEGIDDDAASR